METEKNSNGSIWEFIKFTLITILIIFFVRKYVTQPFIVSGASMDPTFKTGEYLLVDEIFYRINGGLERGDVIVFKYPRSPKTFFIKRVIGLPNETISIDDGKVKIISETGEEFTLDEQYISEDHFIKSDHYEIKLGNEQYFVMGDNRAESLDSRAWGPLDKKYIIGRPFIRILPPEKAGLNPGK